MPRLLFQLTRRQFAVGVFALFVLITVGGVSWGFGRQIVRARQMWLEEVQLEQKVADAQARYDELVVRLEYVRSDEYVEQWARKDAKMARSGEVIVILPNSFADDSVVSPQAAPPSEADSSARPFWAALWESVFAPSD
ncbi:MAG TPA: septum formation initiator family protein [Chloroflexi bacterium]|nr:septum formation initiator family protein [Chloroflexota bacterium]